MSPSCAIQRQDIPPVTRIQFYHPGQSGNVQDECSPYTRQNMSMHADNQISAAAAKDSTERFRLSHTRMGIVKQSCYNEKITAAPRLPNGNPMKNFAPKNLVTSGVAPVYNSSSRDVPGASSCRLYADIRATSCTLPRIQQTASRLAAKQNVPLSDQFSERTAGRSQRQHVHVRDHREPCPSRPQPNKISGGRREISSTCKQTSNSSRFTPNVRNTLQSAEGNESIMTHNRLECWDSKTEITLPRLPRSESLIRMRQEKIRTQSRNPFEQPPQIIKNMGYPQSQQCPSLVSSEYAHEESTTAPSTPADIVSYEDSSVSGHSPTLSYGNGNHVPHYNKYPTTTHVNATANSFYAPSSYPSSTRLETLRSTKLPVPPHVLSPFVDPSSSRPHVESSSAPTPQSVQRASSCGAPEWHSLQSASYQKNHSTTRNVINSSHQFNTQASNSLHSASERVLSTGAVSRETSGSTTRGYSLPPRTFPLRTYPPRTTRMSMIGNLAFKAKEWVDATRTKVLSTFGSTDVSNVANSNPVDQRPSQRVRFRSLEGPPYTSCHPKLPPVLTPTSKPLLLQPTQQQYQNLPLVARTNGLALCPTFPQNSSLFLPRQTVPSGPCLRTLPQFATDLRMPQMRPFVRSPRSTIDHQPRPPSDQVGLPSIARTISSQDFAQKPYDNQKLESNRPTVQKIPPLTDIVSMRSTSAFSSTPSASSSSSEQRAPLAFFDSSELGNASQNETVRDNATSTVIEETVVQPITRMPLPETPKPKNRLTRRRPSENVDTLQNNGSELRSCTPLLPLSNAAPKAAAGANQSAALHTPKPVPEPSPTLQLPSSTTRQCFLKGPTLIPRVPESRHTPPIEVLKPPKTPMTTFSGVNQETSSILPSVRLPVPPELCCGLPKKVRAKESPRVLTVTTPKSKSNVPSSALLSQQEQVQILIDDVKDVIRQAEQLHVADLQELLTTLLHSVQKLTDHANQSDALLPQETVAKAKKDRVAHMGGVDSIQDNDERRQPVPPQRTSSRGALLQSSSLECGPHCSATTDVNSRLIRTKESPGHWRHASYVPPPDSLCDSWLNHPREKRVAGSPQTESSAINGSVNTPLSLSPENSIVTPKARDTEDESWETEDEGLPDVRKLLRGRGKAQLSGRRSLGDLHPATLKNKLQHLKESSIGVDDVQVLTETREAISVSTMKRNPDARLAVIQQGSFGTVCLGRYRGREVAIKMPTSAAMSVNPETTLERFIHEWDVMRRCHHQNIVRLLGGVVVSASEIWLVMERICGPDIHTLRYVDYKDVGLLEGVKMCFELSLVLDYLHTADPHHAKQVIVHRDVKPENVLVRSSDSSVRLCDFGDSEESLDGRVMRVRGATWLYSPPELLRSSLQCEGGEASSTPSIVSATFTASETGPELTTKWDIWSAGCVFQEILGGWNPFRYLVPEEAAPDEILKALRLALEKDQFVPDICVTIPVVCQRIIENCLDIDPDKRPTANMLARYWKAYLHKLEVADD